MYNCDGQSCLHGVCIVPFGGKISMFFFFLRKSKALQIRKNFCRVGTGVSAPVFVESCQLASVPGVIGLICQSEVTKWWLHLPRQASHVVYVLITFRESAVRNMELGVGCDDPFEIIAKI